MNKNEKFNIVSNASYPKELQNFALTLLYYSPKAYEFVREKFHNALPAAKTLRKWLCKIKDGPGYSKASLKFLQQKCPQMKPFSLTVDEMAINQKIEMLPNGKYSGFTDLGNIQTMKHKFSRPITVM